MQGREGGSSDMGGRKEEYVVLAGVMKAPAGTRAGKGRPLSLSHVPAASHSWVLTLARAAPRAASARLAFSPPLARV